MKKKILAAVCAAAVALCGAGCGTEPTDTQASAPDGAESGAVSGDAGETIEPVAEEVPEYDISAQYEWGNVEIVGGGYTTGIYFNKGEEGLVYARTDIGGFYRMDNSTGRWKPLTDQFNEADYTYYGIDGCAVDEKEPNKVYILAGMYNSMASAVLRSEDYGDTWEMTPLDFSCGGNEPARQCDRLVLDPNDNTTLYLGSRRDGLWISHDSGETFELSETFPTMGLKYSEDGYTFGITAIAFDPESSSDGEPCKTIYVGTGDKVMYYTTDGGETWSELEGAPKSYLATHIYVQDKYVYFVFSSQASPYAPKKGALRRYNTETGEWTDIAPDSSGHSWGDLEIDPSDPGVMYVSTMGRYALYEDDNIFRSTDGGETWEGIFGGADDADKLFELDYSGAPWLDWGRGFAVLGWMIGDIEINPFDSNEIIYGTGATIYHSLNLTDWGKEPIKFEVRCQGLEETAVMTLCAANSDDIRLYSGMKDIDGFTHLDVDTAPSHMNGNGYMTETTSISCAFNNPLVAARTGKGPLPISITVDGGETWQNVNKPKDVGGDEGTVRVNQDGTVIYWTNKTSTTIYFTKDYGKTWESLNKSFAVPKFALDNFNSDVIYIFTSTTFYITTDGGETFYSVDEFFPDKCTLTASPEKEGDVWISTPMGGVYLLSDYGKGGLKRANIQSAENFAIGAAKDENSPMTLYVIGMNENVNGIWRSCDSGETWQLINDSDHQFGAIGDSLAADYRTFGQVYFGTNGRGIIMGRIKS